MRRYTLNQEELEKRNNLAEEEGENLFNLVEKLEEQESFEDLNEQEDEG